MWKLCKSMSGYFCVNSLLKVEAISCFQISQEIVSGHTQSVFQTHTGFFSCQAHESTVLTVYSNE